MENTEGFNSIFEFIEDIKNQSFILNTSLDKNLVFYNDNLIIPPKTQLNIVNSVVKKIKDLILINKKELSANNFIPFKIFDIVKDEKTLRLSENNPRTEIESRKDWFSHDKLIGTSYEVNLYSTIDTYFDNPNFKIDGLNIKEFFLLRNEQDFKIFNKEGRAFEPDFVLFLLLENSSVKVCQVFIEPKGEHLVEKDQWKEDLLLSLNFQDSIAKIIGLEFFNPDNNGKKYFDNISKNI